MEGILVSVKNKSETQTEYQTKSYAIKHIEILNVKK